MGAGPPGRGGASGGGLERRARRMGGARQEPVTASDRDQDCSERISDYQNMAAHVCNPNICEMKAAGSGIRGQP